MRIPEYFKHIQSITLSPIERVQLYQRFLDKMWRMILWKRWMTYARYTSVTVGSAACIILVTWYITRNNWSLYQLASDNGIYMSYQKSPGMYAEAMSLGAILHAQWDIILSKDGQKIDANQIANNEKIILQEWATLEFLINKTTKAKITWPAAFELQDLGETNNMRDIAINLVYGDYLEVHTQQPVISDDTQPDNTDASTPTDNIIIKTKTFEVKRLRSWDTIDLVIKKDDSDHHTIENNGWELIVEKFIQDKKVFTSVKTEQVVAVGDDVTLLADQAKLLSTAITNEAISTRYALDSGIDSAWPTVNTASIAPGDTPADVVLLSPSKQVVTEEQTVRLDSLLSPSQLMNSVEWLVVAVLNNTPGEATTDAAAIASRIRGVYDVFGISLDSQVVWYYNKNSLSIKELTLITDQLMAKIDANYYVGPTYTKRLKWLLAWFLFLETATPVSNNTWASLTFDELVDRYNLAKFQGYLLLK